MRYFMQLEIIVLSILLCILFQSEGQLQPGGFHVCSQPISVPFYVAVTRYRIGYQNYRTRCGWFSRCTRTRQITVAYTASEVRYKRSYRYFCCNGWAKRGNTCPTPICNPGCKNGQCTNPNTCTCRSGYQGNLCERDIDECKSNPCDQNCVNTIGSYYCSCRSGYRKVDNNPISRQCANVNECQANPCKCSHAGSSNNRCSSICTDTQGSYVCSCNTGYQLDSDRLTCKDIDECSSSSLNDCEQNCLNSIGSFTCSCNKGYLLSSNGRSCTDVDECTTLNGGCSQSCINKPGSHQCSCRRGFRLRADGKTCEDINECLLQLKPCDARYGSCQNIIGSYRCSCRTGYQLLPDKKSCIDVNECSRDHTNGCQHNCTNTEGSYICSCLHGYRLNFDRKLCDDIEECNENKTLCDHICINTVGSYKCKCKDGHGLEDDKHNCKAFPCQTIFAPVDGKITCSGYVTDDSCHYVCKNGFDLIGSSERTCLSTSQWSGIGPRCKRKFCPPAMPPNHGSILLPCLAEFEAQCFKRCSQGYYLEGSESTTCILKRNKTQWTGQDTQCKVVTSCEPNPCLNGGQCSLSSGNSYICDCTNTLFVGEKCEINQLIISDFPPLIVNEQSVSLYVFAKPTIFFRVQPHVTINQRNINELPVPVGNDVNIIEFTPPVFEIYSPNEVLKFRVTPKVAGVYEVQYSVIGNGIFIQPKPTPVYVFKDKISLLVDYGLDSLNELCGSFLVQTVILKSTCELTKESGTRGFVFIEGNNIKIPLSIVGVTEKRLRIFEKEQIIDTTEETDLYLQQRKIDDCRSCYGSNSISQVQRVQFVLEGGFFPMLFFKELSAILPFWIELNAAFDNPTYATQNLVTKIISGSALKRHKCFHSILPAVSKGLIDVKKNYALYHTKLSTMVKSFANVFQLSSLTEACYVGDLTDGVFLVTSSSPFLLIKEPSEAHIIRKLSSKLVIVDCKNNSNQHSVMFDMQLQMKSFDGNFRFRTLVKFNEVDKFFMAKFSAPNIGWGTGKVDFNIMLEFLGGKIIMEGKNVTSNQTLSYGGNGAAEFRVDIDEMGGIRNDFSSIRFQPESNIWFDIPVYLSGGQMIGISNKALMRASLYSLIRSETRSEDIQKELFAFSNNLRSIFDKKASKLFSTLKATYELLNGQNHGIVYEALIRNIERVKYSYAELAFFIRSLSYEYKDNSSTSSLINKLKIFVRRFKRIEEMLVLPDLAPFELRDIGDVSVAYTGSFCVYNLCFKELKEVKIKSSTINDFISISVKLKVFKASHRLSFGINDSLSLNVNKYSNRFNGNFSCKIYLFDQHYPTTMYFDENTFRYSLLIDLRSGLKFEISHVGDLQTAAWNNIVKTITGYSDNIKNFSDACSTTFNEISTRTANRINLLKQRDLKTREAYENVENNFKRLRLQADSTDIDFRKSESDYNVLLTNLVSERMRYQSMINNNQSLFLIDRDVTRVCKIKKCPKVCIPMVSCEVCQVTVKIPSKKWNCQTYIENIKSSQLVEVDQTCQETKYFFETIYTGSCAEDPQMRQQREQQRQQALSAIGTGIGSLFFGPIGGLIGGIIGGLLGGLFSSCDVSYEVITHKRIVTFPCKNYTMKVVNTKVPRSTCVLENVMIDGDLSEPKECNCKEDECKVKTTQLNCIKKNKECQAQRKLMLQNHGQKSELFRYFSEIFENLEDMENGLEDLTFQVDEKRLAKDLTSKSLNRTRNRLSVAKQEIKLSQQNLKDEEAVLGKDLCVYRHFQDSNGNFDYVIRLMKFQTQLPIVNNILMQAVVLQNSTEIPKPVFFVYDLNDPVNSFKAFAKKVVYTVICENSRQKRSVDADLDDDTELSFTSWDDRDNSTKIEKSCMTFKLVTELFEVVSSDLNNIVKESETLLETVNSTTRKIDNSLKKNEAVFGNISNHLGKFESLLTQEMNNILNLASISNLYQIWREGAEVFTSGNNFSSCLGFKDCIDTAFRTLSLLPVLIADHRDKYFGIIENLKLNWATLEQFPINTDSLADLSNKTEIFQTSLQILKDETFFCSEKPKISEPKLTVHNVQSSNTLVLYCGKIESDLPVTYNWKLHDTYLDEEYSDSITIKASVDKAGVYTCIVSSVVGESSSSGILVNVYESPKMISQPVDVVHVLPSEVQNATILCEVSGYPKPKITWYYKSYVNLAKVVLSESGPELILDIGLNKTDGFYYCKAVNLHGEIESNHARVDVLETELPSQYVEMSVDFVSSNNSALVASLNISELPDSFKKLFNSSEEANVTYCLNHKNGLNTLYFTAEAVYPSNVMNASSMIDIMMVSRKAREALAIASAKFSAWAASNQSKILLNGSHALKADNITLNYKAVLNKCKSGFQMHINGIVCVQCKAGFHRRIGTFCQHCPRGFYSSLPGSAACLKCNGEKVTMSVGATSARQCVHDIDSDKHLLTKIYAISGGALFLLLMAIIIGAACFRHHRKRLRRNKLQTANQRRSRQIEVQTANQRRSRQIEVQTANQRRLRAKDECRHSDGHNYDENPSTLNDDCFSNNYTRKGEKCNEGPFGGVLGYKLGYNTDVIGNKSKNHAPPRYFGKNLVFINPTFEEENE